jgi:3-isopropylmalate/(R)-2-methylmalate dehydratase small subunit
VDSFTTLTGQGLPLQRSDVDTDQIIPAVYLKRVTRSGFEDGLFAAWRADPAFVLNQPQFAGATILVAGPDFGTGSSREHAVWALRDYGFRVVVSARFGDIFRGNAGKGGLVTAQVDQSVVRRLWALLEAEPGVPITVDLQSRTLSWLDVTEPFELDDYTRWRLLEGLDDVDLTLRHEQSVSQFEANRPGWLPTTA